MNSLRHVLGSFALAALTLSLAAMPADARTKRAHNPAAAATSAAPAANPSETPEQARVRLNAEQSAAAKAQNDRNAANKAAYEAAVAQRDADIARQKAAEDAAHAKWLADTVPCKDDPNTRCAKPAAK